MNIPRKDLVVSILEVTLMSIPNWIDQLILMEIKDLVKSS